MSTLLVLSLLSPAAAGDPGWYSGDLGEATRVTEELDLDVELRPLGGLLPTGSPQALDALVLRCTSEPLPRYVLEERLAAGESALAYVDYQRAEAELRLADEALSCASAPVDAALAARCDRVVRLADGRIAGDGLGSPPKKKTSKGRAGGP